MKLHLQCRTQEEIGEAVGMTQQAVDKVLQQIANLQKVVNPSELDPKLGAYCRSYALEAERKMGQMLKETERAKGMRAIGGDKRSGGTVTLPPEDAPTLSALGLSKRESAEAQMLAELPHSSRYDAVEAIPLPDAYRQTIFDLRCAYGHVRAKKGHSGAPPRPGPPRCGNPTFQGR